MLVAAVDNPKGERIGMKRIPSTLSRLMLGWSPLRSVPLLSIVAILTVAHESKGILDRKMYERWLSLMPSERNRTQKSVMIRWSEMVSKFKSFFIIS